MRRTITSATSIGTERNKADWSSSAQTTTARPRPVLSLYFLSSSLLPAQSTRARMLSLLQRQSGRRVIQAAVRGRRIHSTAVASQCKSNLSHAISCHNRYSITFTQLKSLRQRNLHTSQEAVSAIYNLSTV